MELVLTGRHIRADEADRLGLVDEARAGRGDARGRAGPGRRDRRAAGRRGARRQGRGPCGRRDAPRRWHPVRAGAVPGALRNAGPGRRNAGLPREATRALGGSVGTGRCPGTVRTPAPPLPREGCSAGSAGPHGSARSWRRPGATPPPRVKPPAASPGPDGGFSPPGVSLAPEHDWSSRPRSSSRILRPPGTRALGSTACHAGERRRRRPAADRPGPRRPRGGVRDRGCRVRRPRRRRSPGRVVDPARHAPRDGPAEPRRSGRRARPGRRRSTAGAGSSRQTPADGGTPPASSSRR